MSGGQGVIGSSLLSPNLAETSNDSYPLPKLRISNCLVCLKFSEICGQLTHNGMTNLLQLAFEDLRFGIVPSPPASSGCAECADGAVTASTAKQV